MKEAECCTRIVAGFLEAGHEAYKIPDAGKSKWSVKRPYDITAAIRGDAICIEAKINPSLPKKLSSFLNLFEDHKEGVQEGHQIERLDRLTKNKNAACFAFLVVFKNNRKASLRRHELYIIDWRPITQRGYRKESYIWNPKLMKPLKCVKKRYDLSSFFDTFPRF